MSWDDKSVKYLKTLREETDMAWDEITEEINEHYGFEPKKTLNAVRKTYKRFQDTEDLNDDLLIKNIQTTHTARKRAQKVTKENKAILDLKLFEGTFLEELSKILKKTNIKLHKRVKLKSKRRKSRAVVAHISDTHIGCKISREEMGGINRYNPEIAARRFALYFKTLSQYKEIHREESELVMVLNGDIFAGVIHSLESGVLPMATQFSLGLSIFSQGISFISQFYSKIRIVGLTGNHDRYMHKDNKGRQSDQKWDSFATNLYVCLKQIFKEDKGVEFIIPKTPYALIDIQGHNYFITHGDTVINVGNPGKSINTESITKQVNSINAGLEGNIDALMVAHVHKATYQSLDNGANLIINGTLSGTDPFAQSIGILSNNPVQQIFEVTREHCVGDMRFVRLDLADDDESLEEIVEPMELDF